MTDVGKMVKLSQHKEHLDRTYEPLVLKVKRELREDLFGPYHPLLPEIITDAMVLLPFPQQRNLEIKSSVPSQNSLDLNSVLMEHVHLGKHRSQSVPRQTQLNPQIGDLQFRYQEQPSFQNERIP